MAKKQVRPTRPKPEELPQVLYVAKADDDNYFGHPQFQDGDFDDGERVGIYELREIRTLHVTRGLR